MANVAALLPITTLRNIKLDDGLTMVSLVDCSVFLGDRGSKVPHQMAALREYAAECGKTAWLDRAAAKIVERIGELERQLRVAPPQHRDELEDALRTSRTTLVILWRGLERSPGMARRLEALSGPTPAQPRLRLVRSE